MAQSEKTRSKTSKAGGFTDAEREAMQDRAREAKAESAKVGKAELAAEVLAKIADMPEADRELAQRLHEVILAAAPELSPRLWYGMPAYANSAGKTLCFIQPAGKFKARYATLGFSDEAKLDDGAIWPTSFAVLKLTAEVEARVTALVRQAVGGGD